MKKENDVQTSEKAIALTKCAGLIPCVLFIVGNVGETEETIDETIEFLQRTDTDSVGTVGGLWIFPGTGLYQYTKKLGIIDDCFWLGDEPYMVYTHEHSLKKLRFFTHAIKKQKKISEMSFRYRAGYTLYTYIEEYKQKVSIVLNKYPKIKSILKSFYPAIKHNVYRITRSEEIGT
jgi:radical SAM superfamily enzyme YgiQ (UPF0313 family)